MVRLCSVKPQEKSSSSAFRFQIILYLYRVRNAVAGGSMWVSKSLVQSLLAQFATDLISQLFAALVPTATTR